jgi:hypothetical protein
LDEGFSLWFSEQTLNDLFGVIFQIQPNPPLYYAALKLWRAAFGTSELSLRSLSAVLGAATVPVVGLAARWIAPLEAARSTSLLAAISLALASVHLHYSQEARAYALLMFSLSVTIASFAYILHARHHHHSVPFLSFGVFSVSMALLIWSHYIGLIYSLLIGLFVIGWWLVFDRSHHLLIRFAISAIIFLALAAVPILFALQMAGTSDQWIPRPTVENIVSIASLMFSAEFGFGNRLVELFWRIALFAPLPILGFFALWRTGGNIGRTAAIFLTALSIGPVFLIALESYFGKPLFLMRTVAAAQVSWVILCAFAPIALRGRGKILATGAVLVSFGLGAVSFFSIKNAGGLDRGFYEDWRAVAQAVRDSSAANARILTDAGGANILNYYLRETDIVVTPLPRALSVDFGRERIKEGSKDARFADPIKVAIEQVISTLRADRSAWLIIRAEEAKPIYEKLISADIVERIDKGQVVAFQAR